MTTGHADPTRLTIDDLPRLVAAAAATEPDRTAFTDGDSAPVSYADLHRQLTELDTAMGGVLGPAELLPVVLTGLIPERLADPAGGGLDGVVTALLADLV